MNNLKLFTPGPLLVRKEVKGAMFRDIGSRDDELIEITRRIRENIIKLANASYKYTSIPLQGSGTFGVEAAIDTFIPHDSNTLVLVNGMYGDRIVNILEKKNKKYRFIRIKNNKIHDLPTIERLLESDNTVTHAMFVYCETTTGIVNPLERLIKIFRKHGIKTIIDAVSAFGALPVDAERSEFDAMILSSNKCLESVPGISIIIAKNELVMKSKNNATSFCLDLYQQWQQLENNGQWRFTPPTHVLQALDLSIDYLIQETVEGRLGRYVKNKELIVSGLKHLGIDTCVDDQHQSPICLAFTVKNLNFIFDFKRFYEKLKQRNILIYHAMDHETSSFRIGCIGNLLLHDIEHFITAVSEALEECRNESLISEYKTQYERRNYSFT